MNGLLITARALKRAAWILAGLLLLIVALAGAAVVYANHSPRPLIRYFAAGTGRQIRVDGPYQAHLFSLHPRLVADRVTIGNPPWTPPGTTAQVARLSMKFELLPFSRPLVIRRLEMDGAAFHLLRDDAGRANWQWADPDKRSGSGPPLIRSLWVRDAQVDIHDARRDLTFQGTASAYDLRGELAPPPLRIEGAGQLNGRSATFAINADPLATVSRGRSYRFAFDERSSGSRLSGRGLLPRPFDFRALETSFEARGEDLKDLYFLTGVHLPDTGTYKLSGRLVRQGTYFTFKDLLAASGKSDMHGALRIDASGARSNLRGDLHSKLLRVADLGARAAGRTTETAVKGRLLPDTVLPLKGMRRSDSTVDFHAEGLELGHVVMHSVGAHLTIDDGILTVAPLSAVLLEGSIAGGIKIDATEEVPRVHLDIQVADLRLGRLDREHAKQPPVDGLLRGRLSLTGRGRSIHQFAATANGTATAVLPHGTIRASLAELTGIDVTRGLGLLLTRNQEDATVRCGIASFRAHDGTLTAQTLVIDTEPVLITGKGDIDLDSESLNLELRGRPKKPRLLRLRAPLSIHGTIAHPAFGLERGSTLAQAGAAVALGVVLTPLASVLAFVDPGLAKDADCSALLAQGNAEGVKARGN